MSEADKALPQGATRNDDGSVTLTLSEPAKFGSLTVAELTIKKPKARHFRSMPLGETTVGHMLDMLSAVSGQPKEIIGDLSQEDMQAAIEVLGGFTPKSLETGDAPSP